MRKIKATQTIGIDLKSPKMVYSCRKFPQDNESVVLFLISTAVTEKIGIFPVTQI